VKYGSVCAGIEAITMGWHGLGFEPAFFSEIDAAPRAVLAHHYPHVPLHGDFTTIQGDEYGPIDLLVGGTPCQSFSVAGLRGGLDDDRGNLALEFLRLADRTRARWLVWENVPGVLSSNGGRDFGSILGGLVELGYGFAYRVLDAQHFGVPQRRRRVFLVGHLGDWRRAAAVLFERHSLQGHPAPRREKGQAAPTIPSRRSAGGGLGTDFDCDGGLVATAFQTSGNCGAWETGEITGALDTNTDPNSTVLAFTQNSRSEVRQIGGDGQIVGAIAADAGAQQQNYVAFQSSQSGVREVETHATLDANMGSRRHNGIATASAVRRLTPRECERLQGFPPDFTLVPYRGKLMADGPRYKMLGNSMAVPVVRWIGQRIAAVEALQTRAEAA